MGNAVEDESPGHDRLLQRTIHEENVYYARLNFFLVFESVLLAAFVSVDQNHITWPALAWAIPLLGGSISALWWRAQARQYGHVKSLGERVTAELPEYRDAYAGRTSTVSATWLMTHGVPLLFLLIWIFVRMWLSLGLNG